LKTPLRAHAALIADFRPDGKRSEKMERYGSLTRASTHQRLPSERGQDDCAWLGSPPRRAAWPSSLPER
jgi:hypothetical protein